MPTSNSAFNPDRSLRRSTRRPGFRRGPFGRRAAVALMIMAACSGMVAAVAAAEDPPEHAAYLAMVRADAARDAALWAEALRGYEAALQQFENLVRTRPDVMPRSVARRVEYCRGEIEDIRARLAPQAALASVESAREREVLLRRIAELEARLAAAEAQGAARTGDASEAEDPTPPLPGPSEPGNTQHAPAD